MKYLTIAMLALAAGCVNVTVNVDPVKSWEGHYKSTNEFYQATKDILLDKDESIWVLSDKTLNRVLKNVERK